MYQLNPVVRNVAQYCLVRLADMGQRLDNARSLYIEAIQDGDYVTAIDNYAGERYTQHSTPVKDGKDGFVEFFADFVKRNPIRDVEIIRSFEDGQYVFLHVVQTLNNGEYRYVTADIFDTDDASKLIEHWDIIAEMRAPNSSGHTQIDGPTEPTNVGDTENNKLCVRNFLDQLQARNVDAVSEFIATDLVQHSADFGDGLDAYQKFVEQTSMRYIKVHNVIGSGSFVAALSETETLGKRQAVIDLFRLDQNKIVEHWDVTEEITPKETWMNSGKF